MSGNSPIRQHGPITPGSYALWRADGMLSSAEGPGGLAPSTSGTLSWLADSDPANGVLLYADRSITVTAIVGFVEIANTAAATVSVYKAASGTALSAAGAVPMHTGSFDAAGTPGVAQRLTLTTPAAVAPGERLGLRTTGIFGASVGNITVTVQ